MAEPQNNPVHHNHEENPIVAFFMNFISSIKLPLPLPSSQKKNNNNSAKKLEITDVSSSSSSSQATIKPVSVSENEVAVVSSKPAVTFPRQTENFASLKLEAESEEAERTTNPLILWQVYAIGGFFIMKWAWTRWNERKGQKKSDNEPPPSED